MKLVSKWPLSLLVAIVAMSAYAIALVVRESDKPLHWAGLFLVVPVSVFLLRGHRTAWVIAILSAASQFVAPLIAGQQIWLAPIAGAALVGLGTQSSRLFVSTARRQPTSEPSSSRTVRAKLQALPHDLAARVGGDQRLTVTPKRLIGFGIAVVIFSLFERALSNWREESGHGSLVATVLWKANYVLLSIALLVFIAGMLVVAYRAVKGWRARNSR